MTVKVIKSTTKGQITLPQQWRQQFVGSNFLMEVFTDQIVVKPIDIEALRREEVVFDAERDNDGKGVPIDDMISLLKKIQDE